MKQFNRLAAALAAAALLASITPAAVFAAGENGAASVPSSAVTLQESEPTPTPTPVVTPTPTPEVTPTPTPVPLQVPVVDTKAYSIGNGTTTSLDKYDTNIVLNLNCRVELAAQEERTYYVEVKDGDFIRLSSGRIPVVLAAGSTTAAFSVDGLKLAGDDNKLNLAFYTQAADGQMVGNVQTLSVGEAPAATPVPTTAPTQAPTATPEPDPQAASLIIKSSSIGTESVNAGEEFTLKLTIYATTSGNRNAEDVVVSVTPGEGVTVASGSSSTYIGAMAPGASQTVSFPMKALDSFTGGISTIAVSVTGSGAGSQTNISVPVVQPDRFEITRIEIPEILTAGEENLCSVVFVNKGRNPVNNLTVTLAGTNMATTSQSEYVGNLAGGTQSSVDFDIAGVEPGELKATVTVQYEGSNGELVTLTQEVGCVIEEVFVPVWDDPGYFEEPIIEEPAPAGLPLWAKLLIGAAAVAVVVVAVVIVRKRKAKKAALEADDEDI